jgi:hypothetical protein
MPDFLSGAYYTNDTKKQYLKLAPGRGVMRFHLLMPTKIIMVLLKSHANSPRARWRIGGGHAKNFNLQSFLPELIGRHLPVAESMFSMQKGSFVAEAAMQNLKIYFFLTHGDNTDILSLTY